MTPADHAAPSLRGGMAGTQGTLEIFASVTPMDRVRPLGNNPGSIQGIQTASAATAPPHPLTPDAPAWAMGCVVREGRLRRLAAPCNSLRVPRASCVFPASWFCF
ncbi:hypothetical protein CCC_02900 [Paramagnetospirillum magnetotacticum MS-1]|uniref:Uncharacterized protein n=1 Tax=Paramagnetospirillum magnetotacticum MS-1 TaxID=272627 RepID=A0A0C2V4Y3_PARME|nr:hypothetical protein CCC_02900 [Paramagnetospirillum magnetotacticum MS-1]